MVVQGHLKPPPRVLWVACILQTILVALDKEFQMEPESVEGEGRVEGRGEKNRGEKGIGKQNRGEREEGRRTEVRRG